MIKAILRNAVAAVVVLIASAPISAADQSLQKEKPSGQRTATWIKEPSSFLGISLGQSLDLPACPEQQSSRYAQPFDEPKALCQQVNGDYVRFRGAPDLGIYYELTAQLFDNKPLIIMLTTSSLNFESLRVLLTERYGRPHAGFEETVQNQLGASFASTTYRWVGNNVQINLNERSGKIDESRIFVNDKQLFLLREQRRRESAQSKAAAL